MSIISVNNNGLDPSYTLTNHAPLAIEEDIGTRLEKIEKYCSEKHTKDSKLKKIEEFLRNNEGLSAQHKMTLLKIILNDEDNGLDAPKNLSRLFYKPSEDIKKRTRAAIRGLAIFGIYGLGIKDLDFKKNFKKIIGDILGFINQCKPEIKAILPQRYKEKLLTLYGSEKQLKSYSCYFQEYIDNKEVTSWGYLYLFSREAYTKNEDTSFDEHIERIKSGCVLESSPTSNVGQKRSHTCTQLSISSHHTHLRGVTEDEKFQSANHTPHSKSSLETIKLSITPHSMSRDSDSTPIKQALWDQDYQHEINYTIEEKELSNPGPHYHSKSLGNPSILSENFLIPKSQSSNTLTSPFTLSDNDMHDQLTLTPGHNNISPKKLTSALQGLIGPNSSSNSEYTKSKAEMHNAEMNNGRLHQPSTEQGNNSTAPTLPTESGGVEYKLKAPKNIKEVKANKFPLNSEEKSQLIVDNFSQGLATNICSKNATPGGTDRDPNFLSTNTVKLSPASDDHKGYKTTPTGINTSRGSKKTDTVKLSPVLDDHKGYKTTITGIINTSREGKKHYDKNLSLNICTTHTTTPGNSKEKDATSLTPPKNAHGKNAPGIYTALAKKAGSRSKKLRHLQSVKK